MPGVVSGTGKSRAWVLWVHREHCYVSGMGETSGWRSRDAQKWGEGMVNEGVDR